MAETPVAVMGAEAIMFRETPEALLVAVVVVVVRFHPPTVEVVVVVAVAG